MSQSSVQSLPVSRRELSYYLLFGTVLIFVAVIAAFSMWMLFPVQNNDKWMRLGHVDDFPPSVRPYRISVNDQIPAVWVVNIDGEIKLFDKRVPIEAHPCIYAWNEANMRFEDPCMGAKFRLSGTVIGSPAQRDLDQYGYKIDDGYLYIDLRYRITGLCRQMPGELTMYPFVWDEPGDPLLCEDA